MQVAILHNRLLSSLSTAILTVGTGHKIQYLNAAAEMLFEVSTKKALGVALADYLESEGLSRSLTDAIDNGQPATLREVIVIHPEPDRGILVDCAITPIHDVDAGQLLVLELTRVDRLMRLAREGRQRQRYAANQALIRGVAHEIKNPLGGLRGAAQLLDQELDNRDLREYTRIIIHEADRLRKLVDRMTGRYQPARIEPVNIHEILEHVRKLVLVELPLGVSIERDYDPSLPPVAGEKEQLIQAILNLVRNALQAVDERGIVRLRTRIERQITIGGICHRYVVRTDIEDNGPGIPEALADQVFDPLITGRDDGTGLGLSITQDIVNRHGGLIAFESTPGNTCFSLYLPVEESS